MNKRFPVFIIGKFHDLTANQVIPLIMVSAIWNHGSQEYRVNVVFSSN